MDVDRFRLTRAQKIFLVALLTVNVVLWLLPSDVAEQVARNRHVLLGRYSRRHFAWILALAIISIITIRIHLSPTPAIRKLRIFRLLAVLMGCLPTLLVVDVYLRLAKDWRYVLGDPAYHRPPHARWVDVFEDKPKAMRSYPNAPPGFGTLRCRLTTDGNGFRNLHHADRCDVVVLGDSFAEGSHVSDEHVWPYLFSERSGASTYNLGMSGFAPQHFRAALHDYGLALKPAYVFCLIYEGNDFHSARAQLTPPSEWSRFFKRSPIVDVIDQLLIRTLGPIGSQRPLPELDVLSWMPIAYPPGPHARYYAFPPTFLLRHYVSRSDFESDNRWQRTKVNLDVIREACVGAGAQLVVLYAPTKARVVLPLVWNSLPAEKVRTFTAMKADSALPPAGEFLANLFAYLDVMESVTTQWCVANNVPIISLTDPLRDAVREGRQVYYTYDEHWSPVGHETAADVVLQHWRLWHSAPASVAGGAVNSR